MYRYLIFLCFALLSCDSTEVIETQDIPQFQPADVTYRIDGDLEDIRITFLQGDTLVHRENMPELNEVTLPFEHSFRAEHPQLLRMQINPLDCNSSLKCNATLTILVDGDVYREMHLPDMFTDRNESILSSVFAISAWDTDPTITMTYQILSPYKTGTFRYKDRSRWRELNLADIGDVTEIDIEVPHGFIAEAELTTFERNSASSMSVSIFSRNSNERLTNTMILSYAKRNDMERTLNMSLPIYGY